MSDFQDINVWQKLNGKIQAMNEFSLPEIADGFPDPTSDNAVGMKDGVQYKWNRLTSIWEPLGGDIRSVEIDTPTDSDALTKAYMNTTYPDNKIVTFTTLTNYPDQIAVLQRVGLSDWYINLYGNKLT
ncbi:hypothetical protein SAMN05428988_0165 [Chitinophaga sp. YR573]|uniref:hypothetical protein n=1 Tax=Chitinophaga sp. YR573 TaxID=1881040 RepID=UPI0008CFB15E|nr:hypothetical protein [Chitinophaga sp. YR573]SEV88989.1 hypothetical protein SAMN05428988_0165 [Chitinophaga sp. YR573]